MHSTKKKGKETPLTPHLTENLTGHSASNKDGSIDRVVLDEGILGLLVKAPSIVVLVQEVAKRKRGRVREPEDQSAHPRNIALKRRGHAQVRQNGSQAETEPEDCAEIELKTEDDAEGRVGERIPVDNRRKKKEKRRYQIEMLNKWWQQLQDSAEGQC